MYLNLTDFSHIFHEKPLLVICNCTEFSKTAFVSGITKKTDLMAHALKTSDCFPSRRTFRPDVEEADCCQQQGGG